MKTIKTLAFVAAVAVLTSCNSSKHVSMSPKTPSEVEVDMPCVDVTIEDGDFYRELGTATNINMQNARSAALNSAKSMIKDKLGEFVQGLSADYSRNVRGNAPVDKVQQIIERELTGVVDKMLNDAQKICEKMTRDDAGVYHSYIAIQIPKGSMVNNMANTLSANEELETEFNRDQFRKYAEEKMAKMQAAKKAAGY